MPTPVERQADRQAAELRVLQGLALYAKDGYSLSQAAAISQAPKETIRRRSLGQGAQSDRVANGSQRLSAAEEEALVKYILQMEASGFPLRQTDVEASAQALISARWKESTAPEPLGIHWFSRFVDRHKHRLAFKTKASLSRDRVRGLTKSHVGRFYMILESLLQKYNFDASCILSMDETGVQHGVASRSFKYAVSSQPRDQTIAAREDGSQELTTVIETIAADGSSLPPVYVFKGKMVNLSLAVEDTLGGFITGSESGWTNTSIAQQWFERVFIPGKKDNTTGTASAEEGGTAMGGEEAGGEPVPDALPAPPFVDHGRTHIAFYLADGDEGEGSQYPHSGPPRALHAWVGTSGSHLLWSSEAGVGRGATDRNDAHECGSERGCHKAAREKAFTAANIRKGYATTGIWPFNPNAIPEAMFFQPTRSEAELEEAKEDAAWMESELAEQLYSLVGQQRSLKAKSILMQAVRDNKEATATAILFNDLTERIRMHAAAMKAKPRPFRVAQDGGARLYTSDESIAMMQAAQEARQAEDQRKEAAAVEREERREAKEKKDEENRQKQALLKAARAEKRKKEEAEKQQRLVEKLRKRKAREAEEAEKQLRKKRKIDALLAKSGQNPTFTPS